MLDVTDKFRAAMVESHRVSLAATVYPVDSGVPVATQLIGGSVRMDRDARVRRQGSVTVAFDLESNIEYVRRLPFGSYVRVERGVLYADGTIERVVVGHLRVNTVSWSEVDQQANLELGDRMTQVQEEPFPVPWTPNGVTPSEAIIDAVYDVFGDSIRYYDYTDQPSEQPLADTVFDQDRAQAISDLASSIAARAYFNNAGDFVLEANPDPDTTEPADPVLEIEVGPDGTLEEVQENLDRSAVRNGVAVRGQPAADAPPIYSLAVDDDPDSPTMWGGPFGKVASIVTVQGIADQKQADSTARNLLNVRLGIARVVTLRGVPMPALEPDDTILACYMDGREELMRVNAVSLPLTVDGAMEVTVTAHYRPDALGSFGRRRSRSIRVVGGDTAWRELADASVVAG